MKRSSSWSQLLAGLAAVLVCAGAEAACVADSDFSSSICTGQVGRLRVSSTSVTFDIRGIDFDPNDVCTVYPQGSRSIRLLKNDPAYADYYQLVLLAAATQQQLEVRLFASGGCDLGHAALVP